MKCLRLGEKGVRAMLSAAKTAKVQRAKRMPNDVAALLQLTAAHHRLTEMGWREAIYAPKDTPLLLIECGSSGFHTGYRDEVGFWIQNDDTWPSHPVLFRLWAGEAP